jgi:hypothetical protein
MRIITSPRRRGNNARAGVCRTPLEDPPALLRRGGYGVAWPADTTRDTCAPPVPASTAKLATRMMARLNAMGGWRG